MSGTLRKVHGPRRCAARTTRPNKAAAGFDPVFGELHHVITFKTFARAAAIVLAPLLIAACGVNTIPTKDEKAKAQWAEVQNQYHRRNDLIPNLFSTVKGYPPQELHGQTGN